MKNEKNSICISATPIAAKLGRGRDLGWEIPSLKSREHLTKWLGSHYSLNVFKAPILKKLSLLSVVLRFLDDKIILMLSYLTFRSGPP